MQLISPDVLLEAKGLSPGAAGFLLFVGMLLWGFGWRWHRFWVVFGITLAAGLMGLSAGRAAGGQVLAVGILLAVSAGMLALELAKIVAFITGGTAAWVASSTLVPGAQELWVVFLCGGLLGVVLYRLWTMLATSFLGVLISWHMLLVMLPQFLQLDAPKFAAENAQALNFGAIVVTGLGLLAQTRTARGMHEESESEEPDEEKEELNWKKHSTASPGKALRKLFRFSLFSRK